MLRVNRFAAAMDIIDAGTSAPIAIAANAKPTNHDGNISRNRPGTIHCAPYGATGWMLAAMPMKPSRAINPSRKLYAGKSAALRLMATRLFELSTPVTECGYMNSASADPSASVEYAENWAGVSSSFWGGTAAKMLPKPPSLIGITTIAAMTVM